MKTFDKTTAAVAAWGLCLGAMAHGAWVYPEVDSASGTVRPSAIEARIALGQSGHAAATNAQAAVAAEAQARAAGDTNVLATAAGLYQPIGDYLTEIPAEVAAGAAAGATALQPGWAPTGSVAYAASAGTAGVVTGAQSNIIYSVNAAVTTGKVSRAVAADMLASPTGKAWLEFGTNGTLFVVQTTNTTSVYVTATEGEGYNGPPAGTVWSNPVFSDSPPSVMYEESNGWNLKFDQIDSDTGWTTSNGLGTSFISYSDYVMPRVLYGNTEGAIGLQHLDWVPATNVYQVATEPTVISIVDAHNSNGDAHPTLARQADLAGYVSTNAYGCGVLSGTTPTIAGLPFAYWFAPTNAYTLSVSTNAPRGHYSVTIIGTNACTFGSGIVQFGTWTPGPTNWVSLKPSYIGGTNFVYEAAGRAF